MNTRSVLIFRMAEKIGLIVLLKLYLLWKLYDLGSINSIISDFNILVRIDYLNTMGNVGNVPKALLVFFIFIEWIIVLILFIFPKLNKPYFNGLFVYIIIVEKLLLLFAINRFISSIINIPNINLMIGWRSNTIYNLFDNCYDSRFIYIGLIVFVGLMIDSSFLIYRCFVPNKAMIEYREKRKLAKTKK